MHKIGLHFHQFYSHPNATVYFYTLNKLLHILMGEARGSLTGSIADKQSYNLATDTCIHLALKCT